MKDYAKRLYVDIKINEQCDAYKTQVVTFQLLTSQPGKNRSTETTEHGLSR